MYIYPTSRSIEALSLASIPASRLASYMAWSTGPLIRPTAGPLRWLAFPASCQTSYKA